MTQDPEIQVLARQTALKLISEFGEELPAAVDEVLSPSTEREEVYDLVTIIAAATLVVASAQLVIQILDRERKAAKDDTDEGRVRIDLRVEITKRIEVEYPSEVKLVPDAEKIVIETIKTEQ